jgi:hypothetical protein
MSIYSTDTRAYLAEQREELLARRFPVGEFRPTLPFPSFDKLEPDEVLRLMEDCDFPVANALAWEETHLQRAEVLRALRTKKGAA